MFAIIFLQISNILGLQIFIPADGMVEIQQNLQELIGQFDKGKYDFECQ